MKRFYLIAGILFLFLTVWSQSNKRIWDYQLSKLRTIDVVRGDNKIYFLSEGGIYYFVEGTETAEPQLITKMDGLSGSDFQAIDYNVNTNSLVVTYQNSMVDVINANGTIHPFPDIRRKNIAGNKTIYNATCHSNYCYLSCGFGIVVIDLIKLEIKDSFIIGAEGNFQPVYDVAIDNEYIYAATDEGIKMAEINSPNLLDFANWHLEENKFINNVPISKLEVNPEKRIWAIHKSVEWHGDRIFSRHSAGVWYPEYENSEVVYSLSFQGDKTVLGSFKGIQVLSNDKTEFLKIDRYPFQKENLEMKPKAAILDTNGDLWIADYNYGAIRVKDGNFHQLSPEGPIDNDVFSMDYSNNKLWIAGGGRNMAWDNLWKGFMVQSYSEGKWDYIDATTNAQLKNISDVVQVLPTLSDPNHIFVATWGGGIFEFKNGELANHFTEANSTLQNIVPGDYYVRIGGMDFDSEGNLWISNSEVEKCLQVFRKDRTWQAFTTPDISYKYKIGDIEIDDYGNIWTIVPREKTYGLYVMSNDGTQKKHLDVKSYFSNGTDEPYNPDMNNVYCIKKDMDGQLWVGTTKGVAVYADPENVFAIDPYYATQPGVDEDDNYYHPLLANEIVTAIAIDGGNRKWCGTRGSGIYLVSPDGKYEIEHYTTENSNLISDVILSLEYDGDNGFLYVGTQLGLVTFRTQSKNANASFKNVYAYPNPVRSGYQGDIYIAGMMEDSNVKITTVSGRLVYETTSLGGQAVWNGCDLAGNRVQSGVYLAFCASKDGAESTVTKILVIK
jgi:ligand-binding sensor domain-containing protein